MGTLNNFLKIRLLLSGRWRISAQAIFVLNYYKILLLYALCWDCTYVIAFYSCELYAFFIIFSKEETFPVTELGRTGAWSLTQLIKLLHLCRMLP